MFLDRHWGRSKCGIGRLLVAGIPREDMVVVLARAMCARGLAGQVFTQHRRVGLERLERIDDHGQLFVFHDDGFNAVGRRVTVLGDHDRDFLHLKMHFLIGEHSRDVAGQGRHPVQFQGLQIIRGQDRDDAGDFERLTLVDA